MADWERIGLMLSGMGAGFQGQNVAPYLKAQKELTDERKKAMIQDAWAIRNAIDDRDFGTARYIAENRVEYIKRLGGDPKDTMDVLANMDAGRWDLVRADANAAVMAFPQFAPKRDMLGFDAQTGIVTERGPSGRITQTTAPEGYKPPARTIEQQLQELKLRTELAKLGQPDLGDVRQVNDKVTNLLGTADEVRVAASALKEISKTKTRTDQLGAIFTFMRALDPGSVVRESETGMLMATGGVADAMVGFANKLLGEGPITPNFFDDMVDTAIRLANDRINLTSGTVADYLNVYEGLLPEGKIKSMRKRIPGLVEPVLRTDTTGSGINITGAKVK